MPPIKVTKTPKDINSDKLIVNNQILRGKANICIFLGDIDALL
ncbi:hypothetical protein BBROOKSOX_1029 [Bathymodiolus brooksi thiotrophic gill symbiont]|nr:hypothetical protein BBROOKSOX_1029 [Bathymodiolus brooksi thiotrophic gill symbiont]